MTVERLLEEIYRLHPDLDTKVAVDKHFKIEVSVVHEDGGDFLNIGVKEAYYD